MDIGSLTINQAREIAALVGGVQSTTKAPPSGRAVVVVDRGWIFAGDLSLTPDGYVKISNAVHVFGWSEIGFARVLTEWQSKKVDIRPLSEPVEVPSDAIVFRVPVPTDWGKK